MSDERPDLRDLQAMLPIESWRVYYDDGSTVDGSSVEQWRAAPAARVQGVLAFHADGYTTALHGHDRYWLPGLHPWPKIGSAIPEDRLRAILDQLERERVR